MNAAHRPFWKDDPEAVLWGFPGKPAVRPYSLYLTMTIRIVILLIVSLLLYKSPLLMLGWIIFFGSPLVLRILLLRRLNSNIQGAEEIQARAREAVGASYIGSAIHVAGHPRLQRHQQVVMAIVGDRLNLYSYEDPTPLDAIPLKDIQAIHTVSYDEDRLPHLDAIDSAAQDLQITFLWQGQSCTCLFRRMRRMKAVDWFHAIQQTRLLQGLAKDSPS